MNLAGILIAVIVFVLVVILVLPVVTEDAVRVITELGDLS